MSSNEHGQYLIFIVSDEEYGFELRHTQEILQYQPVTRVPCTPPWIRGVFNMRGKVLPVVDLAARFGFESLPPGKRTCIVVTRLDVFGEKLNIGILADSVSNVLELETSAIEPPPAFGTAVQVDFLQGLVKKSPGYTLLLDLERIFSADELLQAGRAAGRAAEQIAPPQVNAPVEPSPQPAFEIF